ncbi:armadillo-type protein [Lyophyllum atratum]|nr:armadillo-type protein [Lyophyllum atratum]
MSDALVSNTYLGEVSSKIRSKPMPWEGYHRAGLITSEELALIKKVDRRPRFSVKAILLSDGHTYARLYISLLDRLQRLDAIQYLLVHIWDALTEIGHEERISMFLKTSDANPDYPFLPLLRALDTQDEFVQLKATLILTILTSSNLTPVSSQQFESFLKNLATLVQGTSQNGRDVAVQCLEVLLTPRDWRQAVWAVPSIVAALLEILQNKPRPQMSYQVVMCFWLLSFEQNVAEELNKKYDAVPLFINVAQAAREKVLRVVVATFRNLVAKAPVITIPDMLDAQLLPFLKNLSTRKWQDDDVLEDVQFLRDELNADSQILATYDKYTSKLSSGHPLWMSGRESERFWSTNAERLNDNNCEQLKTLLGLLKDSTDPLVLAIAAHDVGQYVKYCDKGKKLMTDLGGKERVMELMTHEDSDVRYHAMISVQQLASQSWRVI